MTLHHLQLNIIISLRFATLTRQSISEIHIIGIFLPKHISNEN